MMNTQTAVDLVLNGDAEFIKEDKVNEKYWYREFKFGFYIITVTVIRISQFKYIMADPDRVKIEMEFDLN